MPDDNQTEQGPKVAEEEPTAQTPQQREGITWGAADAKYLVAIGPTGPAGPQGWLDWEVLSQNMPTTPSGTEYIGPTGPSAGYTVPLGPLGSNPGRGGYVDSESPLRDREEWRRYKEEPPGSSKKQEYAKNLEDVAVLKTIETNRKIAARHVTPELEALVIRGDLDESLLPKEEIDAFVLSIDIRRSTELMLKAIDPVDFANFLLTLSKYLKETVFLYNGIFEKFTGDGILACFPTKFCGDDAGFFAICAAQESHQEFAGYYQKYRNIFKSVLLDVGLGIGIDYGKISIAYANGSLTIVGEPVVYACRLNGAPPGMTYLNQQAYVEILRHPLSKSLCIKDARIDIKHEGNLLAYSVMLHNLKRNDLAEPQWLKSINPITPPTWSVVSSG